MLSNKKDLICGKIRFECEIFGTEIRDLFLNSAELQESHSNQCYYSLKAMDDCQDLIYIEEDRPGESYRILFLQLKNQMGQLLSEYRTARTKVIHQLPKILHSHELFQDVMIHLAQFCYESGCVMHATGLLIRTAEEIEPLTELDRNAAGLVGIPLDKLEDISGEKILLARVYSAGLPPLLLFRDKEVIFPTRSWFPAGLMKDWQPWRQNVEFHEHDLLALHSEFSGSKAELKLFHEEIANHLQNYQKSTSTFILRARLLDP